MTPNYHPPQPLQLRPIHRARVHSSLVIAALVALALSGCGRGSSTSRQQTVPAVFYQNASQCEVDVRRQQEEYQVLLKAHQNGTLAQKPTLPALQVQDCKAQMLAAQQAYRRSAPTYATLSDCQSEGVNCEPVAGTTAVVSGYRPRFGGAYFYPYGGTDLGYTQVVVDGQTRQVLQPRSVYQSATAGQVVTPNGDVISSQPGKVNVSRSTTVAAPARPTGTAARGTIRGRSSSGFGSTYKSTGRGGK